MVADHPFINAGGIRIKKITYTPGGTIGLPNTKEYFYVNDYRFDDTPATLSSKLSSGQLQRGIFHSIDQTCINQYNNCVKKQNEYRDSCLLCCAGDSIAYENCLLKCPDCDSLAKCY
jgi:hypothetical protein